MILVLRGNVSDAGDGVNLIMTTGGVGYEVQGRLAPGNRDIWVIEAINQRDGQTTLYGFEQRVERELAMLIAGTPGVGPATAARIVHTAGHSQVVSCARTHDVSTLATALKGSGVGRKTIEKVLAHLGDALPKSDMVGCDTDGATNKVARDAQTVVAGLGYSAPIEQLAALVAELEAENLPANAATVAMAWVGANT